MSLLCGIIGDVVGSIYELNPIKSKDFVLIISGVFYGANLEIEKDLLNRKILDNGILDLIKDFQEKLQNKKDYKL